MLAIKDNSKLLSDVEWQASEAGRLERGRLREEARKFSLDANSLGEAHQKL